MGFSLGKTTNSGCQLAAFWVTGGTNPQGFGSVAPKYFNMEDRYTDGLVFTMQMQEIVETLSAAKAPKKDGKGNSYVDVVSAHMPIVEAMQTASRKAFKKAFCC